MSSRVGGVSYFLSSPLCKVSLINFEPPDIDLRSACHVYPLFRGAWIIFSTIYIEQTDLGIGLHNLMDNLKPLTFRVKTFQLLLSMKSQLALFDIDNLEMANCSIKALSFSFTFWKILGKHC